MKSPSESAGIGLRPASKLDLPKNGFWARRTSIPTRSPTAGDWGEEKVKLLSATSDGDAV